jgi:hypothetical protein
VLGITSKSTTSLGWPTVRPFCLLCDFDAKNFQPSLDLYHHHPLYWVCSEDRILSLPIHSLHRRRLRWVHIATSYIDGYAGKHRGSRCLTCAGPSSREKQTVFERFWGLIASSLPRHFFRPICSLWRPRPGTPSSSHLRLLRPPPFWAPTNHPLQTSYPIHYLRRALACGWSPPPPHPPIPGTFPGPTPFSSSGLRGLVTP